MECYFAVERSKNQELILDDADTKHITKVLRHKINDEIVVIFQQIKYVAKIIKLAPVVVCQTIKTIADTSELTVPVTLVVALLKGEKFDLVVQKAVELGVYQIVPIQLERCVSVISPDKRHQKIQRWQKIAKAAAQQANRNLIPLVQPIITTIRDLQQYHSTYNFLAYENTKPNNNWVKLLTNSSSVTIVIGPEGGISNHELTSFAQLGFTNISLGPTILRAETAPLYALSVINYFTTFKE